jgi:hypothetical protein
MKEGVHFWIVRIELIKPEKKKEEEKKEEPVV